MRHLSTGFRRGGFLKPAALTRAAYCLSPPLEARKHGHCCSWAIPAYKLQEQHTWLPKDTVPGGTRLVPRRPSPEHGLARQQPFVRNSLKPSVEHRPCFCRILRYVWPKLETCRPRLPSKLEQKVKTRLSLGRAWLKTCHLSWLREHGTSFAWHQARGRNESCLWLGCKQVGLRVRGRQLGSTVLAQ